MGRVGTKNTSQPALTHGLQLCLQTLCMLFGQGQSAVRQTGLHDTECFQATAESKCAHAGLGNLQQGSLAQSVRWHNEGKPVLHTAT